MSLIVWYLGFAAAWGLVVAYNLWVGPINDYFAHFGGIRGMFQSGVFKGMIMLVILTIIVLMLSTFEGLFWWLSVPLFAFKKRTTHE